MSSEQFTAIFDAQDNLSGVLNNMAGSGNGVIGMFGKIGKAAATVFATKKVIDFGKECLSTAREFESGMAEVFTLLPDISADSMARMKSDVKDFVKETGNSLSDTISALYQAVSAGVAQDDAISFLETANKTAVGGVTSLEVAVDGLTSVVNAYGKDTISAERASDLMFTTMKLGKTTIGELSHSISQVVPMAVGAGVSFEDVSASLAALTKQGHPTATATREMRGVLSDLSSEGTQTDKIFRKIAGKSFKDFIKEGHNLQDALESMSKYAKANNLGINDLFGNVLSGSAALALTSAEGAQQFTEAIQAMGNAAGATDAAYETMENTSEHRIKKMKAAWEVMKADIGANLADAITPVMQSLSANWDSVTGTVTAFWDVLIAGASGAAQVIGPIITGLAKNAGLLQAGMKTAMGAFATAKVVSFGKSLGGLFIKGKALFAEGGLFAGAIPKLAAVGSSLAGMALPLAGVAAGITAAVIAYKIWDKNTNHWADDTLKSSEKLLESAGNYHTLAEYQAEMKQLQKVIQNPNSKAEELSAARSRITEIADLLNKEYNLNINVNDDGLDDAADKVGDIVKQLTDAERVEANRDYANYFRDMTNAAGKYQKALEELPGLQEVFDKANDTRSKASDIWTEVDTARSLYKTTGDVGKYVDATQKAAQEAIDKGIADGIMSQKDYSQSRKGRELWNGDVSSITGAKGANDFTQAVEQFYGNANVAYQLANQDLERAKGNMKEFEDASKNAGDALAKMLVSDKLTQNEDGIRSTTDKFRSLGETLKQYGAPTDDLAKSFVAAEQGFMDLQTALQQGSASEAASSFIDYKKAIDDYTGSEGNVIAMAAVMKNGFADIESASKASEKGLNNIIADMKTLGDANGLFEGLKGNDDVAAKLTEMARAIDIIPDTKSVSFNAETNGFEVVDDLQKRIDEMAAKGTTTLQVNADGDIGVLDTADQKLKALQEAGEVSVKFNVDTGGFDILNKAGANVGTIEADGKVNWETGDVPTPDVPDVNATINVTDNATPTIDAVQTSLTTLNAATASPTVNANDNASGVISGVLDKLNAIPLTKTVTINAVDNTGAAGSAHAVSGRRRAKGTDYWEGGLVTVNDQSGIKDPTELIYENGRMFTLAGKNVLTSLERGAKIFTAAETQAIMAGDISVLRKRLNDREMPGLGALSNKMFGDQQFNIPVVPAYANGTTNSADTFIAGDRGPELIIGKQGSTVFPAEETEKIINRADTDDFRASPPKQGGKDSPKQSSEKKILIEINGTGGIKTDNKQAATEYTMRQIKPIIMEMFEQELYEEGDVSRDF